MSAHVLLAGGGDYGLLRLRIIYYDSAWPRTVNTKGAGGQLPTPPPSFNEGGGGTHYYSPPLIFRPSYGPGPLAVALRT